MPLGMMVGLDPGGIVLDGEPAPPRKEAQQLALFDPLLWHGYPSQQLLNSFTYASGQTDVGLDMLLGLLRTPPAGGGEMTRAM